MRLFLLVVSLTLPLLGYTQEHIISPIVQVHGSGASNPSRCYWHVLEAMEAQTKIPIRMTYRATASGNGQSDFVGNVTIPQNDFSSGDYPMRQDRYNTLKKQGIEMVHLPVLLGAIGFFHSVPVKPGHTLNMTSCLLARVFRRDITDWNHPDIQAINPNADIPVQLDNYGNVAPDQSFPITVARRLLGSSSTFGITKYMNKACPAEWPEELVGSRIDWEEDTKTCPGTSLMVNCVRGTEGTIGYVDAGLGHDEGLKEVALKMDNVGFRKEFYLTSANAISKGGILPVLDEETSQIPTSADDDWSAVDLINQVEGYVYTWPIVGMTYIYVRKDLPSFIPDPRAQSLLVAFLKNMFDDSYASICESRFQFIRVQGKLRDLALEGINMLQTSPNAPEWVIEPRGVLAENGQSPYVISARRQRSSTIEQEILISNVEQTEQKLEELQIEFDRIQGLNLNLTTSVGEQETDSIWSSAEFGDDEEMRLTITYILVFVSLGLWFVSFVFMCMLKNHISTIAGSNLAAVGEANTADSKKKKSSNRSGEI